MEVRFDKGVFLPAHEFWLNPRETRNRAFVSNVHRAAWHMSTIATPSMLSIMESSLGAANGRSCPIEFHQPRDFSTFQITLFPAENALGSAQMQIKSEEGNLLYMSDFGDLLPPISSPVTTLVIETIYGHSKYCFPPFEEVIQQVVRFCLETLEEGEIPVLLGMPWGKAGQIFSALAAANLSIALHPTFWRWAQAYESVGADFPPYERLLPTERKPHVWIGPRSARGESLLCALARKRIALFTGEEPQSLGGVHYDAIFPISEHVDYTKLLRQVETVAPRQVLTFHGFAAEFARDLRARGYEAWALCESNQLEFPLGTSWTPSCFVKPKHPTQLERTGFGRFCLLYEKVAATTGQQEKIRLLQGFLRRLSDPELSRVCVWLTGGAFPRRNGYSGKMECAVIRKALQEASELSEGKFHAVARLFEDPGSVAAQVLLHQPFRRRVEICDVQAAFVRLSDLRNPLDKCEFLKEFLGSVSAIEAKTIVHILSGIGLREDLVEKSIAAAFGCNPKDVAETNVILGDIGRTAVLAHQNRLETAEIALFRPVHCMLPNTEDDFAKVWECMSCGCTVSKAVWLEEKWDGIRAQVHSDGTRSEIYGRDLRRITEIFPEVAQAAQRLGHCVVLDGELVPETPLSGRLELLRFQKVGGEQERDLFLETKTRFTFRAFDLLFLDGASLLRKPLCARRAALESLEFSGPLRPTEVIRPANLKELNALFEKACACEKEGFIAKEATSAYLPGRRVESWLKLRKKLPSLDVVVVGARYGSESYGRRLHHLIFALRRRDGCLVTAGRVRNRLTDSESIVLTKHFEATTLASHGNYHEVRPTIVIEIAFDALEQSTRYESGFVFRRPELKRVRGDKSASEIDSLEFAEKFLSSVAKPRQLLTSAEIPAS